MLGKAMIAASIRLFGDGPLGWRLPSALCGIVGLWAFGRAMWLASGRAMASVAAMVLLAISHGVQPDRDARHGDGGAGDGGAVDAGRGDGAW
jgi:4-amino-4-deoxy-L-arabinose transferase-like glycosyltransferase